MSKVIGISGSLREGSYNTALLRAAREMFPDQLELATLHGIPLYDADRESADGIPEPVEALKQRIRDAAGVILCTPEYNNSMPGVFKNAVDWLSRPSDDIAGVFHGRPFTVMGATPGGFGTNLAQSAWLPVLRTLRTQPWLEGRLMVSRAAKLFDDEGRLTDEDTRERLRKFVGDFLDFAGASAADH